MSPADAPDGDEADKADDKSGAVAVGTGFAATLASVAALVGASLL
jgi:hypothetical protein